MWCKKCEIATPHTIVPDQLRWERLPGALTQTQVPFDAVTCNLCGTVREGTTREMLLEDALASILFSCLQGGPVSVNGVTQMASGALIGCQTVEEAAQRLVNTFEDPRSLGDSTLEVAIAQMDGPCRRLFGTSHPLSPLKDRAADIVEMAHAMCQKRNS